MNQQAAARAQALTCDVHPTPEETTIVCAGKITSDTTAFLQETVQPLIPQTRRILFDLTSVEHMDSSGMGMLVKLWISTKRADCELKVINLNERIKDLLRISNLSKILEGDREYHKYLGA
jgi:anti-sigma B factor antagonist